MRPRSTSSTRRHSRAAAKRPQSELAGPMRKVIYIFERKGDRGGGIWWLVLSCGHAVARKQDGVANNMTAIARMMMRPFTEKLAPKRCQCHYCGSGSPEQDPWILIQAFGGPLP